MVVVSNQWQCSVDKTRNRTKEALRTEEARSSKEALTRDPKHNHTDEDKNP
jgi:hypothetical protein